MTFLVRYQEIFTTISLHAGCFHDIFSLHFHYISRQISLQISLHRIFTTSFHDIFTTNFHYKGTNRQGRTDTMGTHRQIFTTNFHYKFHYKGTNRQGRTDTMGTHRQIFTTNFHYKFHHMWCKSSNFHYM